jgi:DNA adenine methylase
MVICAHHSPIDFGGKSTIAAVIWELLGDVPNYVEPMFGSGAVLLARPHPAGIETVNDRDCHIVNVWRAIQHDPEGVTRLVDEPVNEITQHSYHAWLVEPGKRQAFEAALSGDPDYYDPVRAARWLYGINTWIGSGWCSGDGPWQVHDGQLVDTRQTETREPRTGVHRQYVHLGDAGQGVHRKRVHLGSGGSGVHRRSLAAEGLLGWMHALCARLRLVRVCCGDWSRVCGPSVTWKHGLTGVYCDPPYCAEENRTQDLYAVDDLVVAHAVRDWCQKNGNNPLLRIVLSGYGTAHDALLQYGWRTRTWRTQGGYANQGNGQGSINKNREVLWYSPHCLPPQQLALGL